jgi:hypothetical protein
MICVFAKPSSLSDLRLGCMLGVVLESYRRSATPPDISTWPIGKPRIGRESGHHRCSDQSDRCRLIAKSRMIKDVIMREADIIWHIGVEPTHQPSGEYRRCADCSPDGLYRLHRPVSESLPACARPGLASVTVAIVQRQRSARRVEAIRCTARQLACSEPESQMSRPPPQRTVVMPENDPM